MQAKQKPKIRTCCICKEKSPISEMYSPPGSLKYTCSPHSNRSCATTLALGMMEEKKENAWKAKKKAYKETRRETRLRATKEACHSYIRLRDKDQLCICCGRPLGDDYHAGHFMESGNYSAVRYDEDNIHAQRVDCNTHKGGDSGDYEIRLREKIGDERVDRIHRIKRKNTRYTIEQLREIEAYYKQKIKELEQ